jgi:minor extracellular serine protease Vpr
MPVSRATVLLLVLIPLLHPLPPPPAEGSSQVIAIIDSGVDLEHPALAGRIVGGFDFVDNDSVPEDEIGHGTSVATIMAGSGSFNGVRRAAA